MNRYHLSILILFSALWSPILKAQGFQYAKLGSFLSNLQGHNKAMGSLVISKGKDAVYQKSFGYGYISENDKVALDSKTKYRVGSITKVFTAVMIFQLIEKGQLKLNTPVSQFFPILPSAQKITISHLLSHKSGLFDYVDGWDLWRLNYTSNEEMVARIAKHPLKFEPGTKIEYSNSGYILLGYILEKIYKKPFSAILKEKITSKIGITDTYYGGKADFKLKEALSYVFENGSWVQQPETDMSAGNGAGAILSTGADLNKFAFKLFTGNLIKKESLNFILGSREGTGIGLEKTPFYEHALYGHSGQIDYFQSWMLYFPKESLAVTILINGFGGESINTILKGVLHIVFNKPFKIPNYESVQLKPEELEKFVGEYSCIQPALKINITRNGAELFAQAEGQPAFPLKGKANGEFHFSQAGVVIKFSPDYIGFVLNQGGGEYKFNRLK
ncbi:MAG TPA: serine hydrolase domain-containing protein [Pedobacter sp.]